MSFVLIQLFDNQLKVCRVCLAMDVKMHDLFNEPLKTHFESIIGVPVMSTTQLPMYLCYECAELVRKYDLVKKRCLRGQALLFGLLQNGVQLSQHILSQIDRKQALLKSPCDITKVETIEYNPFNDFETESNINDKNESMIDQDNNADLYTLDDISIPNFEEAFQDVALPDVDDALTNKGDSNELPDLGNMGQEYLNILSDDFVEDLIRSEPELLSTDAFIPDIIEPQKPDLIQEIIEKESVKTLDEIDEIIEKQPNKTDKTLDIIEEIFNEQPLKTSVQSSNIIATVTKPKRKRSKATFKSPRIKNKYLTTSKKSKKNTVKVNDDDSLDIQYKTIDLTPQQQFEEIEKRKQSENYKLAPFKCNLCYRGFENTTTWNNHNKKHDPNAGALECRICKYRFRTNYKLRKHVVYHAKKYACISCSFVSMTVFQAKLHERWHKGVMYKCEICGKVSTKQNSHLSHMRNKHSSQYICSICGYSFVSEQGLNKHRLMMHKDVLPLQETPTEIELELSPYCQMCNVKFESLEAYKRHTVTSAKHAEIDDINLSCRVCGTKFPSVEELRTHRTTAHRRPYVKKKNYPKKKPSSRSWPAQCEHCLEEISNARDYLTHVRRAHPDRPLGQ